MNVGHINRLYERLGQGNNLDPNGGDDIRFWMNHLNISFAELSFTEAELGEKIRRVMVQYINSLYERLGQGNNLDPNGGDLIRGWMESRKISFAELSFTEAELKEKMYRVMVQYINDLYARLGPEGGRLNPNGVDGIRSWMESRKISFTELSFTEAELEEKMRRVMVQYINDLYAQLGPNSDESIRFWMSRRNISFAELNFTEAELEEKMRPHQQA